MTVSCVCPKVDVSIYRPNQGARYVPGAVDARCGIHGELAARFGHQPTHCPPANGTTDTEEPG